MKLTITEQRTTAIEIEKKVTVLNVFPFDTGVGAVPTSLFTGAGYLLVGKSAGAVQALAPGTTGQVLTADPTAPLKMKWASGSGGASANLTNNSGGSVVLGDVIILDSSANSSFKTTNIYLDNRVIGVAGEGIAAGASGKVLVFPGTVTTINCDTAAVARGDFLVASSTVKRATSIGPVRQSFPVIAVALTAKAGGSTGIVTAMIVSNGPVQGQTVATSYTVSGNGTATTEKFMFSTGIWYGVPLAAMPAERRECMGGTNLAVAAYLVAGSDSANAAQTSAFKLPYGTETMGACTTAAAPATARTCNIGPVQAGLASWSPRGNTGSGYNSAIIKTTFASETSAAAASVVSVARSWPGTISDGTISGLYIGGNNGSNSVVADKITFASDTCAAQVSANLVSGGSVASANFPSAGYSYTSGPTAAAKTSLTGWTTSAIASAAGFDCSSIATANDGNSLAYFCNASAVSFNRVTDTFAAAPSAVELVSRIRGSNLHVGNV